MNAKAIAKRILLPKGRRLRRIRFGPAAGCLMNLDLSHELRIYLGVYERELRASYRQLLHPGMKAFDVGGRDGYSALLIARRTGSEVLSFDCDGESAAAMQRVSDINAARIRAIQAFVGDSHDPRTTLTLDAAAREYFVPDFIKIDVEGDEAMVLRGAQEILRAKRPAMIIEVHGVDEERQCQDQLGRWNYEVRTIDRARFLPEHRPLPHKRWLVCRARRQSGGPRLARHSAGAMEHPESSPSITSANARCPAAFGWMLSR